MTHPDLAARIAALGPWFHNMEIGGVRTQPDHFLGDYPNVKWKRLKTALPDDLTGKSVLDVGCNGGFYVMEMKRRGAARVLGIDTDEFYLKQARFAAEVEQLDIEFANLSVYDVGRLRETFDIVIFMGVLYHLRHPLLALDLIHEHVARDKLLFQSMQRGSTEVADVAPDYLITERAHFDTAGYPKLHFVEHRYSGDPSNWWVPNRACTEAMLRDSGFDLISHPEAEVYLCQRRALTASGAVYPAKS